MTQRRCSILRSGGIRTVAVDSAGNKLRSALMRADTFTGRPAVRYYWVEYTDGAHAFVTRAWALQYLQLIHETARNYESALQHLAENDWPDGGA